MRGAVETAGRLTALLGPTNTGKTHRAVERMLEHPTGMIGLPLRLLAREVYDRISARVGEQRVALVTGEEKRVPRRPAYWVCTVESMPVDRTVAFAAVDEVQLVAHPQRGHVFTDRLLHLRGTEETWFMGSHTATPLLRELLPTARIERYPRLSSLTARGKQGLGALPPRTAVIAFSAGEVYAIAERLRRRRGGAAVVLGALSPRTRNAQVAMYQAGEVDFMVATDAIGMGLNMDVDHVAFASLRKFDGRRVRGLRAEELGQIAGRAGRHQRDGTFGALSPLNLDPEVCFAIEGHHFPPVRRAVWRNSDIDFASIASVTQSLKEPPRRRALQLIDRADDFAAWQLVVERPEVRALARGAERVALLWSCCQIPDYRKLLTEHHATLVAEVYLQLCRAGRLDPAWLDERIRRIDTVDGDIETLMMRVAFIRTWTYIAQHAAWVEDGERFRARTQAIEERLSDALHEQLAARFVDRRGNRRRPSRRRSAPAAPESTGGFRKLHELASSWTQDEEQLPVDDPVEHLIDAPHELFEVDAAGEVRVANMVIAHLRPGSDLLHPEVRGVVETSSSGTASRLRRRLTAWSRDLVADIVGPLQDAHDQSGVADLRGVLYQMMQGLGCVERGAVAEALDRLDDHGRAALEAAGVQIGARYLFLPDGCEPAMVRRRAALVSIAHARPIRLDPAAVVFDRVRGASREVHLALGFVSLRRVAVRVDRFERCASAVRAIAEWPAPAPDDVAVALEQNAPAIEDVMGALGYRLDGELYRRRKGRRRRSRRRRQRRG